MQRSFLPLVTLLYLLGQLCLRAQTDPLEATWTFGAKFTSPTASTLSQHLAFSQGDVYDLAFNFRVGTYTKSGDSVTVTLDRYTFDVVIYTGTLSADQNDISGTVTDKDYHNSPTDPVIKTGTFTAHRDGAPYVTTGTLTYRETDTLYVLGSTQFSLAKFTATGSIDLRKFPNTNPTALELPEDTELNIDILAGGTSQAIYGGKLGDALLPARPTPSRKAFLYLPFVADTFFDGLAALKVPIPKTHKTGASTLTAGWIFTGPAKKPATTLKFSIIGVGRAWGVQGNGNAQGLIGYSASQLGGADGAAPVEFDCKVTFGNATKKITADFVVAGPAKVVTNEKAKPNDKHSVKTSTVTLTLKGPIKPHS